jgi:hypothetical protein
MKTLHTRSFVLLIVLLVTLNMGSTSAQLKSTKKSAKRPVKSSPVAMEEKADNPPVPPQGAVEDQESAGIVEKLLAQSGQKYTSAGGGVWVIRRNGKSIGYFQVVLYTGPGTLSTEVTIPLSKSAAPLHEIALNLLRLSNKLNYVKIGVDKDVLFVRNEARLKSLNVEEFNDNIERVAMAADTVYLQMQQLK